MPFAGRGIACLGQQFGEPLDKILAGECLDREQRVDRGIGEEVGKLRRFRPGAEWHDCRADRGGAETAFEPFQSVLDQDADAIAAAETGGAQGRPDPPGSLGEIAIARVTLAADHRRPFGKPRGLLADKLVERAALRRLHVSGRLDRVRQSAANRARCRRSISCSTSCG